MSAGGEFLGLVKEVGEVRYGSVDVDFDVGTIRGEGWGYSMELAQILKAEGVVPKEHWRAAIYEWFSRTDDVLPAVGEVVGDYGRVCDGLRLRVCGDGARLPEDFVGAPLPFGLRSAVYLKVDEVAFPVNRRLVKQWGARWKDVWVDALWRTREAETWELMGAEDAPGWYAMDCQTMFGSSSLLLDPTMELAGVGELGALVSVPMDGLMVVAPLQAGQGVGDRSVGELLEFSKRAYQSDSATKVNASVMWWRPGAHAPDGFAESRAGGEHVLSPAGELCRVMGWDSGRGGGLGLAD